jgi:hypothetical protein
MPGVFGATRKALGGNLEAGSTVGGFPGIPCLGRHREGDIEMDEGQLYPILGKTAPDFRSFWTRAFSVPIESERGSSFLF